MLRKILGVIVAYAIFVISSLVLFKLSGRDPHTPSSMAFKSTTAAYGAVFSLLSGFVLRVIGKTKDLKLNFLLAVIIAGFALFSFIKTEGSHWTQVLAIVVFAPLSVVGGMVYNRRKKM